MIYSIATLLVHDVVALIRLEGITACLPHSITIAQSLTEVPLKQAAVRPAVLPIAIGHSVDELPVVNISIGVPFLAISMFKAVLKLSSIKIAIELLMSPWSVRQTTPPAAFELLNKLIMFWIFGRQAEPVEFTLSMFFSIQKLPNVDIPVWIYLDSIAALFILCKGPFVDSPINRTTYTCPFPSSSLDLPKVSFALSFDELQSVTLEKLTEREVMVWE
jgi:hypothetical protein